jgi:hypothetical protein
MGKSRRGIRKNIRRRKLIGGSIRKSIRSKRYRRRNSRKQYGGYFTNSALPITQTTQSLAPTTVCTPFIKDGDIFQSSFEPISEGSTNSTNNYLLLNNNGNYVKVI